MKRRNLNTNDVRLRDLPVKLLQDARCFVVAEVESCDDGHLPEERAAYVALANACADELRRRRQKIRYPLPPVPVHEKGGDR